jgi:hypothetical protein
MKIKRGFEKNLFASFIIEWEEVHEFIVFDSAIFSQIREFWR